MYHIPLVESIVFLENQHTQGQTCIPIIEFLDPNYGVKAIKL